MKKARSDSALAALTPDQQAELFDLLTGGMGYKTAVIYCREEYGIKTHLSSLHNAWEKWAKQAARERTLRNVAAAQAIHQAAADSLPMMDQATDSMLHQLAFEAMQAKDQDAIADYVGVLLDRQRAALQADRLALDKAKFEEAQRKAAQADQAVDILKNKKLTPAEVEQRLKATFKLL